jgi:hypothetical protein
MRIRIGSWKERGSTGVSTRGMPSSKYQVCLRFSLLPLLYLCLCSLPQITTSDLQTLEVLLLPFFINSDYSHLNPIKADHSHLIPINSDHSHLNPITISSKLTYPINSNHSYLHPIKADYSYLKPIRTLTIPIKADHSH